jgi:hypothetical protein
VGSSTQQKIVKSKPSKASDSQSAERYVRGHNISSPTQTGVKRNKPVLHCARCGTAPQSGAARFCRRCGALLPIEHRLNQQVSDWKSIPEPIRFAIRGLAAPALIAISIWAILLILIVRSH